MAAAPRVAGLFLLSGLFGSAFAGSSLMRQEVKSQRLALNPGEGVQSGSFQQKSGPKAALRHLGNNDATLATPTSFCNDDFILGKPDTSECTDSTHSLMDNIAMCQEAASRSGSGYPDNDVIPADWDKVRPKGCFKFACSQHSSGFCYFFNDDNNAAQSTIEGTPVCRRNKYAYGANNSADADGGCPAGYEVIIDSNETDWCSAAAACQSIAKGADFNVQDSGAATYDLYPKGCFIKAAGTDGVATDTVYYNAPINGSALPSAPVGQPLCKVSAIETPAQGTCATFVCPAATPTLDPAKNCPTDPCEAVGPNDASSACCT